VVELGQRIIAAAFIATIVAFLAVGLLYGISVLAAAIGLYPAILVAVWALTFATVLVMV
jgi:hypothetical protein